MTTLGRREQHKAATRTALQEAALRLFAERGYENTTVRDVASAAGVTERTFFRYFSAKEELVLGEVLDLIPELREQIVGRPAAEGPYQAVLGALLAIAARRESGLGILFSGPPARFLASPGRSASPVLLEFEEGVAAALAERLAAEAEPDAAAFRASVLARASVGAMRSTLLAYSALPEEERTVARALDMVGDAFAILAHNG
ncbi:TetR family transcriptional regulator [Saccharomonospora sp. NPDC046836]|uniref:TetR family transcriptional regulator n=1 Tax=Saccharomonospora sp. NPDC046836 TaxID=3156921 RepID=UPI0033F2FD1A